MQYIYGYHAVKALLTTKPENVKALYLLAGKTATRVDEIVVLADTVKKPIKRLSRDELAALSGAASVVHQGIIAHCQSYSGFDESSLPALLAQGGRHLLLVLDGVKDPHNLGACMRSANAFGATAVIAPKDNAVGITPIVSKVACGAAAVTPFVRVTNLARTLRWLQEQGVWLVGTVADADTELADLDLCANVAIVMGSEGQGMRRLTSKHCDFLVGIPMRGTVASLNVSVATAICLYEVRRQQEIK